MNDRNIKVEDLFVCFFLKYVKITLTNMLSLPLYLAGLL